VTELDQELEKRVVRRRRAAEPVGLEAQGTHVRSSELADLAQAFSRRGVEGELH
jgi:hypothetical protein